MQRGLFSEEENIRQHAAAAHAARREAPHNPAARVVYAQHPEKLASIFMSTVGAPSLQKTIAVLAACSSKGKATMYSYEAPEIDEAPQPGECYCHLLQGQHTTLNTMCRFCREEYNAIADRESEAVEAAEAAHFDAVMERWHASALALQEFVQSTFTKEAA